MFEDLTVVDLLHRASQRAEMIFENQMGEIDLTARQYAILRVVSKSNRPSQTDIVGATGIDRSTVAEMTRRLAKKGLVRRRRNQDDARAFAVLLTAAGIQTVALASQRSEDKIYAAVKSLRGAEFVPRSASLSRPKKWRGGQRRPAPYATNDGASLPRPR